MANVGSTFGDHNTFTVDISPLKDAPEDSKQAELRELLEQLQSELQKIPSEQAEDAEMVRDYADDAAKEAAKDKPNPKKLKITGNSLKTAAENLLGVAPIATKIAKILIGWE